jgi:predicted transcriptional regulator
MIDKFLFDVSEEKDLMRKLKILECLTRKRVEILKAIASHHPGSIRALSRIVERNVKNVFEDLLLLERNKFISFEEEGKSKKPIVRVKKITFHIIEGDD